MRSTAPGKAAVLVMLGAISVLIAGSACTAEQLGLPPDCARGSGSQERLWTPGFPEGPPGNALWLNSTPFGATVRLDGKVLGVTPLWIHRIFLEKGILEISHPGYRTVTLLRECVGDDVVNIRLETMHPSFLRPGDRRDSRGFLGRPLQYGLLVLGSGSVALGLHFKNRADEAYDEYLHTGNERRIRDSYDRAERYDRYAFGCWLTAEVSLIGFLYLLVDTTEDETWSVDAGIDGAGDKCGLTLTRRF